MVCVWLLRGWLLTVQSNVNEPLGLPETDAVHWHWFASCISLGPLIEIENGADGSSDAAAIAETRPHLT